MFREVKVFWNITDVSLDLTLPTFRMIVIPLSLGSGNPRRNIRPSSLNEPNFVHPWAAFLAAYDYDNYVHSLGKLFMFTLIYYEVFCGKRLIMAGEFLCVVADQSSIYLAWHCTRRLSQSFSPCYDGITLYYGNQYNVDVF